MYCRTTAKAEWLLMQNPTPIKMHKWKPGWIPFFQAFPLGSPFSLTNYRTSSSSMNIKSTQCQFTSLTVIVFSQQICPWFLLGHLSGCCRIFLLFYLVLDTYMQQWLQLVAMAVKIATIVWMTDFQCTMSRFIRKAYSQLYTLNSTLFLFRNGRKKFSS